MKQTWKKLGALLLCLLMVLSLTACAANAPQATEAPAEATQTPAAAEETPAQTDAPAVEAEEITVTDLYGREVTVSAVPERIVCLTASATEIAFALGAGDKVVGVDAYSDYPAETADLPKVGDYNGPNVEAILALDPDVIFAGSGLQDEAIEQLCELGAVVVVNEATSYSQIYDSIELTARVLGADASAVIDGMHAAEEEAKALAAADENCPRVYYCVSYGEYGDYTCGQGAFVTDMLAMINAESVTASLEYAWPTYTVEQIIADDPDVILVSGDQAYADGFCADSRYQELRAVKEGHVYAVDANLSSRPGPRIVEALKAMAEILHGDK